MNTTTFFKKVINLNSGEGKVFKIEKWRYCKELLDSNTLFTIHNFIRHYEYGKTKPVEEKMKFRRELVI